MNQAAAAITAGPALLLRPLTGDKDIPLNQPRCIGRAIDCDIRIDDHHISRYHARILPSPSGLVIEDLQSTNGCYINGVRVSGSEPLSLGDELRFYQQVFRVVSDRSGHLDATCMASLKKPLAVADARRPVSGKPVASQPGAAAGAERLAGKANPGVAPVRGPAPRRLTAIQRQLQKMEADKPLVNSAPPLGQWFDLEREGGMHCACYTLPSLVAGEERIYCVSRAGCGVVQLPATLLAKAWRSGRARPRGKGPLLGRVLLACSRAARR